MKRREFIATSAGFGVLALGGFGLFNACDGGVKKVDLRLDEDVAKQGEDFVSSDSFKQSASAQGLNGTKQAQTQDSQGFSQNLAQNSQNAAQNLAEQSPTEQGLAQNSASQNQATQNSAQANTGQNSAQNPTAQANSQNSQVNLTQNSRENSPNSPTNSAATPTNAQANLTQNSQANSAQNSPKTYYKLDGKELYNNSSGVKMAFARLNNGIMMPMVGLGTHALTGAGGQRAMESAFAVGYRHFDTAQMYGNEAELGRAYAASQLPRREVFITTKLSSDASFEETLKSIDASLARLRMEYVDLLLLHSPYPSAKSMYRAMESALRDGKARAIGISNFGASAYAEFIKSCKVIPAVNQCQMHIFHQQRQLRAALRKHGTLLESWSPFVAGSREFFSHPTLRLIADKHGKSVAQVALRFIAELGIPVIPKSASRDRQRENIDIFSFTLDDNDRQLISKLDRAKSAFGWTSV